MRLRITVRRHGLPETPIVWNVATETSTIAQLLEDVNAIIPIETSEWGFDDYAVELKGGNGVNFECLHFQQVGQVMKEEDEVIIRPLLTQDLKIRRVSGRIQISADGKHLVDGVAFGRPLLRRPDRPPVKIPPRKRRRVEYNIEDDEIDDDDAPFLALTEHEDAEDDDLEDETKNRQLVLHADFDDEDSDEDDDFMPGEDEELDENEQSDEDEVDLNLDSSSDSDSDEDIEHEPEEFADQQGEEHNENEEEDSSELVDVSDEDTRAKLRKLHSAFPSATIMVCRHVLEGCHGNNVKEAYNTLCLGFKPTKPASYFTETFQASLSVPKTRSKKRKAPIEDDVEPDSMLVEAADDSLINHYDQNGLPPGSIQSGKALAHMAEAAQISPGKARPSSQRSNSAFSHKSVRVPLESGLTSTPAIDRESVIDDSDENNDEENDRESSSDGTSSSGSNSSSSSEDSEDSEDSDEDNASSNTNKGRPEVSDTSSSGSDSSDDSSSDSSSDDDAPEETSSKATKAALARSEAPLIVKTLTKPFSHVSVSPGQGKKNTKARNQRRRSANILNRFKEKGILPAGTTTAEFSQLTGVTINTSPEDALVALEAARQNISAKSSRESERTAAASIEFEARRQELLKSLQSGGIDIDPEPLGKPTMNLTKASSVAEKDSASNIPTVASASSAPSSVETPQDVSNAFSTGPETRETTSTAAAPQKNVYGSPATKGVSLSKASTPQASIQTPARLADDFSKLATPIVPANETESSRPATASAHSSASTPRRAKLDVSAGRRMLFGALGLKAPKSKKDEEKMRSELMKDVRPLHTPRATENAPEDEPEEAEETDPEAWREKITYRAVECCHEGNELSEPPFPFVQRWDPQQQGGWSQNRRGGKRKKNQRDEPQFYQDERPSKKQKQRKGKHNYAEEQEYLDASYEPSFQEESLMESTEPTQETRLPSDDVEGEIDQQLMNDLRDLNEVESAQVSQGPEDLAILPEDPAALSDLMDGQAKPGMTIAFKELTMSEETNWNPEISAYRTAVVNAILDDGELQLTLALRDRLYHEKLYDAETGERLYGRFEMPDEEEDADDEEDDGIRNLDFSALVEPKIVQDAPTDLDINDSAEGTDLLKVSLSTESQTLSNEDDAIDAQCSHVTETPLHSDAPDYSAQDSIRESVAESHSQPDAQNTDHQVKDITRSESKHSEEAVITADTLEPVTANGTKDHNAAADRAEVTPIPDKDQGKQTSAQIAADESTFLNEHEPSALLDQPDLPIAPDARLKISKIMLEAGWRSSVPSSVMKDIRPEGMQSPGDTQVFEKLMKDMTEIGSNPAFSPNFNGLDPTLPIKKLKTISAYRDPSSSPVRVESSWRTVDSQAPSSPPMLNDEGGSSWVTENTDAVSSPLAKAPSSRLESAKAAKKLHIPRLSKAQELWARAQIKPRRSSIGSDTSKESPARALGLDGAIDIGVEYPKLSVGSSFTSQVSDHGRQPDVNFDDVGLSGDTPKVPAYEDESVMNEEDDVLTDAEPELPSHKSIASSPENQQLADSFSDGDEEEGTSHDVARVHVERARSSAPVLRESPSSDDLPTMGELLSQRSSTREKTTPTRPKPARIIKAGKPQKKTQSMSFDDEDEETTPKASSRKPRTPKREHFLPASSQVRKSPRSHARGSQLQASQSRPSDSQPPKGSQIVDLTLSSDVEGEEDNDAVVSEIDKPKRFRKYALDEYDDDEFEEPQGWVPKKSSSQKPVESRRQTSTGLKASSQSSINPSRKKTTARF